MTRISGPCLALTLLACSSTHVVERGRPEALSPILGRGMMGGTIPRTKPGEPVEDFTADVRALAAAWPGVNQELPRLLRAVVARGSWIDEHHAVTVEDDVLRLRHRPNVVAQTRKLVQALRMRLLAPLQIQVAFVEADSQVAPKIFALSAERNRWNAKAFRAAVARDQARTLARVVLASHNGQWAVADRVSNQVFLSGIDVTDGNVTPRSTTLASGFTIQAAAWRWGEDRAVVALTGLYTGAARGGQKVKQRVHRLLPGEKTYERHWEPHDLELELPVREMIEYQNQLVTGRGEWVVAGLLPRDATRVCAVVLRVDWHRPVPELPKIETFAPGGFALEVIPVALPVDTRGALRQTDEMENRSNIDSSSVSWFRNRAKNYQESQKKNVYNFQAEAGNVDLSMASQISYFNKSKSSSQQFQSRGGRDGSSSLPQELERLRMEVMQTEWPEGTALEFIANHVFVVHRGELTRKLRRLLEMTHEWRNRQLTTDVAFPLIDPATADGLATATLPSARAATLRRGPSLLPGAFLPGRGGTWGELFVGEMHTVLSGSWAPDRASPAVHVYWRGSRLSVAPYLDDQRARAVQLDLRWKQHRLEHTTPEVLAGAIIQRPVDSLWRVEQALRLAPGEAVLAGMQGAEGKLPALLVGATIH